MPDLPSGTVTFLFTDIEGSTRLLQQLGPRYAEALSDHRALLRAAFASHGGVEVDTQGDAFFVAFARAAGAVAAAAEGQRALAAHLWPTDGAVRVRMGLHTGEPQLSGGGYVGLDVHRAARIAAAGHGGQILLSQATRDLAESQLPPGVRLRDLGEHRLKDLQRPEHLYQLVLPELPADFPPLKTLDRLPNNLPVQPTPLVGRERDLAVVRALLARDDVRLVTLTGPGGIGKTRLSIQVAAEASDRFLDGVYLVELAAVTDPGLVASVIAQSLGLREEGHRAPATALQDHLRDKRVLLLLDNFEQIEDAAPLVADLLAACPHLRALVTTRIALHLRGEHEYPVPPLALPASTRTTTPLDAATLSQYAAVALFIERALAVRPDFMVTNDNAPAVAAICARLDGLPLAIELAAARIKLLSPQALLARLAKQLDILTGGARDLPVRQQTLRGAIAWSYNLLPPTEQVLFRRLAVFAGGFTLEAVEAIGPAAGPLDIDVLAGIGSLLDQSLLRQPPAQSTPTSSVLADDEPRFSMLETIREFAVEQLDRGSEAPALMRAYAAYYLGLAEQAESELHSTRHGQWLARLEREHDNLRAVLAWALASNESETGLRLAGALAQFWWLRGHLSEARRWLDEMLALPEHSKDPRWAAARVQALAEATTLAADQGQYDRAVRLAEESLALARQMEDQPAIVRAVGACAVVAHHQGNTKRAVELYEESLRLSRQFGDALGMRLALGNLGSIAFDAGDYPRAAALLEESLALTKQLGDPAFSASLISLLALVAMRQGNLDRAVVLAQESLTLSRQHDSPILVARSLLALGWAVAQRGDPSGAMTLYDEALTILRPAGIQHQIAIVLTFRGDALRDLGDLPAAIVAYRESLSVAREYEDRYSIAGSLEGMGLVAAARGQPERAARLLAAGTAQSESAGMRLSTTQRDARDRTMDQIRATLGESAFAAAWAAGQALTTEQAIAEALGETD